MNRAHYVAVALGMGLLAILFARPALADLNLYGDQWWYWGWPPGDCPTIPDNGCSSGNDLEWSVTLSGAPAGAVITSVVVEYWINDHTYWADLQVYLSTYQNGQWNSEWLWNQGGGSGDLHQTKTFTSEYDGLSPNATWYFVACDDAAADVGCVDEWIIWVYYIVPPDLYDDGQAYCGFSPQTVCPNQAFSAWCDVRNGGGSSSGGFYVDYYASTNTTITTSDYYIASVYMPSIPAGGYDDCDWSGSFPTNIPPGTYWVGWIIDADDDVDESNENNNTAYKQAYQLTVKSASTAPSGISFNPSAVCPGSCSTLSVQGGSLGTGASWKWYSGTCGGSYLGSGSSIQVCPSSTTFYFVRAEGDCNTTSCASGSVAIKILSTAPSGASASPASVCPGSCSTLTIQGGSLGSGASWKWYSGSCGGSYVGSGSSIQVCPSAPTTYFVRAEGDCNTTTCASVSVTMKTASTAPSGVSVSPATVCAGNCSTLTVQGGSLGTGASWKWYQGTCGGTLIGSGPSVQVCPSSTATYYVRAEGDCNTTTCASGTVTVKTLSGAPTGATAEPAAVCPGGSSTLTVQGGSLGTGAQWKWYSGSCGGTPAGSGASIIVQPGSTTNYYVRAEGDCNTTGCASVTVSVRTASTSPTGATANPNSVCPGGSSTLTVQGGSLGTGASWKWYAGGCGQGGVVGTGSSISVEPTQTTTYYVRAEGDCNTTPCASVTVSVVDVVRWYADDDHDGYGDPNEHVDQCSPPSGYVSNDDDCDDTNANVHPGAAEVCGNAIDDDCTGGDQPCSDTWYRDADGDGYGDPNVTTQAVQQPAGYVTNNTDCDDGCATCHPAGTEVCDGQDNDCDGQIDEGVAPATWYRDRDEDGYGDPEHSTEACDQPSGYVSNDDDCNDDCAACHPGSSEVCDGEDNDCDGQTDEAGDGSTWYRDADSDGYGNPGSPREACQRPDGYVDNDNDCDDGDADVHPGATEVCDGKDNDCDGQTDEGSIGATWYRDSDGDGYGNPSSTIQRCSRPSGYVGNGDDCDDGDPDINPDASDCANDPDRIDNNCNGLVDEDQSCLPPPPVDADRDGVPNADDSCPDTPPSEVADASGCSCSQRDEDHDGVNDCADTCPDTPSGVAVDGGGCPVICGSGLCGAGSLTLMSFLVLGLVWAKARVRAPRRPLGGRDAQGRTRGRH